MEKTSVTYKKTERTSDEQAAFVLSKLPPISRSGPAWGKTQAEKMLAKLPFAPVTVPVEHTPTSSEEQAAKVLTKIPGGVAPKRQPDKLAQAQRTPDALDKMAQRLAQQQKTQKVSR